MELFNKNWFAITKTCTKNILICLKRSEDEFLPRLFLYGDKNSVEMSLTQFASLILEEPQVMDFMDKRIDKLEFKLSTPEHELDVCGSCGTVRYVVLRQKCQKTGYMNAVTMAKGTYQRLVEMSSMVQRILVRMDKAAPTCHEMQVKYKAGDLCPSFYDRISEQGFDFCAFANELTLFESGVKDDMCEL